MTLEWFLLIMLLLTNLFWAYQAHVLVNKLLSRSFYDYKFTKDGPPKVQLVPRPNDIGTIDEEESILNELNGMLPK